jgi:hypothetical protein
MSVSWALILGGQQVSHPHLIQTLFRSLQLPFTNLDFHERLLHWQMPSHTPTHRKHLVQGVIQFSFFDFSALEKAVGAYETNEANDPHGSLHPIPRPSDGSDPQH